VPEGANVVQAIMLGSLRGTVSGVGRGVVSFFKKRSRPEGDDQEDEDVEAATRAKVLFWPMTTTATMPMQAIT